MRIFSTLTLLIGMSAGTAFALDAPSGLTAQPSETNNIASLN